MKKFIALLCMISCLNCFYTPKIIAAEQIKIEKNVISTEAINPDFSNFIDVTKNEIPLNSRLRKVYKGYKYTITSKYPNTLDLIAGSANNGINGQQGYLNVEKSSAAAIGSVLGGGLVLGIVSFGITFVVALVATPFIYASNNHGNNKARNEGLGFSNQIPTGTLNLGDSISFTTLIPLIEQPQIKLQFRDIKTSQIYSMSR